MMHLRWAQAVGLAAALSLTACAPQQQAPASPGPDNQQGTAEEQKYGGLLHLPARPTFSNKDPYDGPSGSQIGLKSRPVYEPIVAYKLEPGANYKLEEEVVPWLAEKWEQPNQTEFIFTMRRGVKFQDGVEMTAKDAVYSIQRMVDPAIKYRYGTALKAVMTRVEAIDGNRVRLVLNGPSPGLLFKLLADYAKILPKHIEENGQSFADVAVGTGPFKMVTMDNQKGITFERNPDYWDKGRPYLDGIVVHKGLDDSAVIAALSTGRMDAYNPGLLPNLQQVQSMVKDLGYTEYTEGYSNTIFMQLDRPPFDDIRVRRAMHLALDRQGLIQVALQGKGFLAPPSAQPDSRWAIPQEELAKLPGYRQPKSQDIAEAKQLLKDAGHPNGFKLEMKYRPTLSSSNSIAEPLATAWRDIGIEITLRPEESGVFEKNRRDGNYHALLTTTGDDPFDTFLENYHSSGPYASYGIKGKDRDLDALIMASQTETNDQKRREMAHQMQRRVLEQVYGIPTVERIGFAAWQPWLKEYLYNPGAQVIPFYTPAVTWLDHGRLPDFRKGERLPF